MAKADDKKNEKEEVVEPKKPADGKGLRIGEKEWVQPDNDRNLPKPYDPVGQAKG